MSATRESVARSSRSEQSLQFDDRSTSYNVGRPLSEVQPSPTTTSQQRLFHAERWVQRQDRSVIPVPFYHCSAWCGQLASPRTARRWSIPAEAFDPVATMHTVGGSAALVYDADHVLAELEHLASKSSNFQPVRTGSWRALPARSSDEKVQTVMHIPDDDIGRHDGTSPVSTSAHHDRSIAAFPGRPRPPYVE